MLRLMLIALLAALLPGGALAEPVRFVVFGDMPYCRAGTADGCAAEVARVERLLGAINAVRPAFSLFLGDTKAGSEACTDEIVLRALDWMALADHPLVYTPGDNEWTQCWKPHSGSFDPLDRLRLIRERYFIGKTHLGQGNLAVVRQSEADPARALYIENARWVLDGVVFITLHLPGSNNNKPTEPGELPKISLPAGAEAEWQARNAANQAWLEAGFAEAARLEARGVVVGIQADMFFTRVCGRGYDSGYRETLATLARAAAGFGHPVLLLNGDNHIFVRDQPLPEAPNLTRIMVPGDRDVQAVVLIFDPGGAEPLRFELIGEAGDPPQRDPCDGYKALREATRTR